MPEGDTIHRLARELGVIAGEVVTATSPHPRGRATGIAAAVDGRRLETIRAHGKNLLFEFAGPVILRSHLRMSGRWRLDRVSQPLRGQPWLVLATDAWRASQWNGPVLELGRGARGYAPDLLDDHVAIPGLVGRLRESDQSRPLADALVDQRLIGGIGNVWLAEALWAARLSPRALLETVDDAVLGDALTWARRNMQSAVEAGRPPARAYGRAGRACARCGTAIESFRFGENARTLYQCPYCQRA